MSILKTIIALTALGLLAACSRPVQVDDATPPTVSFTHDVGYEHEADLDAQEHCSRQYGLEAAIVHRAPNRTVYECVRHGDRLGRTSRRSR